MVPVPLPKTATGKPWNVLAWCYLNERMDKSGPYAEPRGA